MLGMLGPGKYGEETDALIRKLDAKAVVLIVVGGNKGNGMSMTQAMDWEVAGELNVIEKDLPPVLRNIANSIDKAGR